MCKLIFLQGIPKPEKQFYLHHKCIHWVVTVKYDWLQKWAYILYVASPLLHHVHNHYFGHSLSLLHEGVLTNQTVRSMVTPCYHESRHLLEMLMDFHQYNRSKKTELYHKNCYELICCLVLSITCCLLSIARCYNISIVLLQGFTFSKCLLFQCRKCIVCSYEGYIENTWIMCVNGYISL
jgi:hypothetical protein